MVVALSHIPPLNILNKRFVRGQRLTLGEGYRLFRLARVIAEVVFGDGKKAQRWLSKHKQRFAMEQPSALLSTSEDARLVEVMLVQVAEELVL